MLFVMSCVMHCPQHGDLTDSDRNRKMWAMLSPIALFASASNLVTNRNNLVPVAIQMDYKPGSVNLR